MRIATFIAAMVMTQTAGAEQVILWGSYSQINPTFGGQYVPGPRDVHINEFVVPGVMPSAEPQVWSWPIEEAPDAINFGIGRVHRTHDLYQSLWPNQRVLDFQPERIELELAYWFHDPRGGAHAMEWRIIGTGTVVPEPATLSMVVLSVFAIASRRRRR